ncbi:hypothetical protein A2572_04010 [Candidatus Collierbacteria bacterium RIFOXYD1_FULL_40_9]|uniref:Fido domain-containing protein n=1 Tax=Candidatus Collierbacteria bacterium RIFOXYD1_FULL_40_9 TaxID=1817731 RepID=A0A1F5FWU7_9BACT|nr:MAG: hypothetical protein A2572_04010 [Candidatus Collierbacteria bacterium RIFOXYD1_FULL_40_9]
MFLPKYSITNKTLSNIVKIELDLFYLKSVEVPVEWTKRLKTESLVKRIFGGTRLLGLSIDLESVSKIVTDEPDRDEKTAEVASRLGLIIKERDLQIVLNLINTCKLVDQISYISNRFAQEKVLFKEMLQINKLIGERMVPSSQVGVLRSGLISGETFVTHALANELPYQLEEFMLWFENSGIDQIHPMVKFAVCMAELMRIAPFENYNEITALFFGYAFLGSFGYETKWVLLEEEIYRSKEKLREAFVSYEQSGWELTVIIEYFVGILQLSTSKARVRALNIEGVSVKYRSGGGRAVALSERQLAIMEEITTRNEMTIKQIREILPLVSDDTILRDIKDLVNKKMVRKRGKTKGAVYVLGKVKSFG